MLQTDWRDHPTVKKIEDLGYTIREPKLVEGDYEITATTLGTFNEVQGRGATVEEALENLYGFIVESEDQLKITQIQKGLDESAGYNDAL